MQRYCSVLLVLLYTSIPNRTHRAWSGSNSGTRNGKKCNMRWWAMKGNKGNEDRSNGVTGNETWLGDELRPHEIRWYEVGKEQIKMRWEQLKRQEMRTDEVGLGLLLYYLREKLLKTKNTLADNLAKNDFASSCIYMCIFVHTPWLQRLMMHLCFLSQQKMWH